MNFREENTADLRGICKFTRKTKVLHWSSVSLLSMSPQLSSTCECSPTRITDVSFLCMQLLNVVAETVK